MHEPDKEAIDFFHNLVEACQSAQTIPLSLIQKLDNLTQTFLCSNDSSCISVCCDLWDVVQKSPKFWQNSHLIITNSVNEQTILQILIKIHQRIKLNWIYEDLEVRNIIKSLMCNYAKQYPSLCEEGNQKYRIQFRKINSIIVEILRYQWNSDWSNFLFDICQAMIFEHPLAQNYFDLITVTFQELFPNNNHLTSNQIMKFKKLINDKSGFLFQTFETFLKASNPQPLLKNCLQAFQRMIPILSPSSIYLNFSFNKILQFLSIPGLSINTLNCILAYCQLNYQECDKIIKSKLLINKQNILMQLLKLTQSPSQILARKINQIASCVIISLEQSISNEQSEQQNQLVDNNVLISSIFCQILAYVPSEDIDIKILQFLVKYAKFYNFKTLVQKLINLTSCPLHNQFFCRQKIFGDSEEYQHETKDMQEFEKVLGKLINVNQKQYLEYLLDEIEKDITNMDDLRFFCRVCWNFHFYLNFATLIAEKFLIFTNKICQTEEKTQKFAQNDQKIFLFKAKILGCCRANLLLILSHQNFLKQNDLTKIFIYFSTKSMMQSDTLVQFNLEVLKKRSTKLAFQEMEQLKQSHLQTVKNRNNRNRLDQLFLSFICSWASKNNKINQQQGNQMITNLLMPYRMKLKQIKDKKSKAKIQLNGLKCHLIDISVKLFALYSIILRDHPINIEQNQQILEQLQFLFMLRTTCEDIKEIEKVNELKIQCCQAQKLLLKLSPKFIKENYQLLNIINNNIIAQFHQLNDDQFRIDNTLDLVICFIHSIDQLNGNLEQQTKVIINIVDHVNNICFQNLHIKHLDLITALVKSKYFPAISQECASRIIYQIFDFCQSEKYQYIGKSYDVLSNLLTNTVQQIKNGIKTSVEKVIIHLTCSIFKILIKPNFSSHYLNKYCQLLYLSIEITKNLRYKFHHKQINQNVEEIRIQFAELIKNQYHYLKKQFLIQITTKQLEAMLKAQYYSVNLQDFLVQLKRGFIEFRTEL